MPTCAPLLACVERENERSRAHLANLCVVGWLDNPHLAIARIRARRNLRLARCGGWPARFDHHTLYTLGVDFQRCVWRNLGEFGWLIKVAESDTAESANRIAIPCLATIGHCTRCEVYVRESVGQYLQHHCSRAALTLGICHFRCRGIFDSKHLPNILLPSVVRSLREFGGWLAVYRH